MGSHELLALRLLIENPKGLYGSEFVALSKSKLGRSSIYTILDRLVAKEWVGEIEDPPEQSYMRSRTRHVITSGGRKAYMQFLHDHGLKMEPLGPNRALSVVA